MKGSRLRTELNPEDSFFQRLFAFLPGLCIWGLLACFVFFSYKRPLVASAVTMAFSLYWIIKVLYLMVFLKKAHKRIVVDQEHADWRRRAQGLDDVDEYLRSLYYGSPPEKNTPEDYSLTLHKNEIREMRKIKGESVKYDQIHHCVIVTVDDLEHGAFDACFESLRLGSFPSKKVMLFFVGDSKLVSALNAYVDSIDPEYKKLFYAIKVVGSALGSGADRLNKAHLINQAAGLASVFFQKNGISSDCVIVSSFSRPYGLDPNYLNCLTYFYKVHPYRKHVCFQPMPIFTEDMPRVNPFLRGYELGSSLLDVADTTLPLWMRRFYGNSMSLELLLRVGFFPEDIVSYSQGLSLMILDKNSQFYEVVPFPIRCPAEAPVGAQEIKSLATIKRRSHESAYSDENPTYCMQLFIKNKKMPLSLKGRLLVQFFETSIISSVWPLLVGFMGWLPLFFISRDFSHPMFYFSVAGVRVTVGILSLIGFSLAIHTTLQLGLQSESKKGTALPFQSLPAVIGGIILGFFSKAAITLKVQTGYMFGRYFRSL